MCVCLCVCVCVCVCVHLVTQLFLLFVTFWTCSPPGSSAHRTMQARILEWVAISYSRESSQSRGQTCISLLQVDSLPAQPLGKPAYVCCVCVCVCARSVLSDFLWPHQSLSMGFSRQETRVGCHFLLHVIFLTQDWTHISCIGSGFFTTEPPEKQCVCVCVCVCVYAHMYIYIDI